MIRPMLASLADAPLEDPLLVYEPKYDGIRAIAEVGGGVTAPGTGSRTVTRPPYLNPSPCPRRVHRLRSSAPRNNRPARPAAHRAPRRAGARIPPHRLAAPSYQHAGPRQRTRPLSGSARSRMGRTDREAHRLGLQIREANARLAQAEDRPRTGIHRRRLDRAAPLARVLRRAAPWILRRGCASRLEARLRRPHGNGFQRTRARPRDEAAAAARSERVPVQAAAQHQRAAALDAARAGRSDQVHRMDGGWKTAPPRVSRAARRQEAAGGAS